MSNPSKNKSKKLSQKDFLDFFSLVERKSVSSSVVLVSDEKKTLFVFDSGKIIAHKSNVERQHNLIETVGRVNMTLPENIKEEFQKMSSLMQWAYLHHEGYINETIYRNLLKDDCIKIIYEHFKSNLTIMMKVNSQMVKEHILSVSPFETVMEMLKKNVKSGNSPLLSCKKIDITVKNQAIFKMYVEKQNQTDLDFNDNQDRLSLLNPSQDLMLDIHVLKNNDILDAEIIYDAENQKDVVVDVKDFADKNAFEIFELDQHASSAAIKKKYIEMVSIYHPDKNAELPSAEKKAAEKIFSLITKAFQSIASVEQRREYVKNLPKEGASKEEVKIKVDAETLFLEGLAQLNNKDFKGAEESFNQSNKILENEKYRIHKAWAQYRQAEKEKSNVKIEQARESLKKETYKDTPMLEALFYLASIEKKLGNYNAAKQYLIKVVDRDPHFMNAKIELNLIDKQKR